MARIADVRSEILPAPDRPDQRSAGAAAAGAVLEAISPDVEALVEEAVDVVEDDDDTTFDDDDFWEALDLMESSSKLLLALQKHVDAGRARIIDNHVADLQHFIAIFLAEVDQ